MRWLVIGVTLAAFQVPSWASEKCFEAAGAAYNIDPDLLRSIVWQESDFQVAAKNINSNGSIDVGLMQINQTHHSRLRKMGVIPDALVKDGCLNLFTGSFILAELFHQFGMSWNTVGMYNAGTSRKAAAIRNREAYAKKINAKLHAVKKARNPQLRIQAGWIPLSTYNEKLTF